MALLYGILTIIFVAIGAFALWVGIKTRTVRTCLIGVVNLVVAVGMLMLCLASKSSL
jgi:hypothetical protein